MLRLFSPSSSSLLLLQLSVLLLLLLFCKEWWLQPGKMKITTYRKSPLANNQLRWKHELKDTTQRPRTRLQCVYFYLEYSTSRPLPPLSKPKHFYPTLLPVLTPIFYPHILHISDPSTYPTISLTQTHNIYEPSTHEPSTHSSELTHTNLIRSFCNGLLSSFPVTALGLLFERVKGFVIKEDASTYCGGLWWWRGLI